MNGRQPADRDAGRMAVLFRANPRPARAVKPDDLRTRRTEDVSEAGLGVTWTVEPQERFPGLGPSVPMG